MTQSTDNPTLDGLDPVERSAVLDTLKRNPELMQLPEDMQAQALESIVDEVRKQRQAASKVIESLEAARDRIIRDRADVEQRWVDDINQYEGESSISVSKEYSTEGESRERDTQPKVNLTRSRTNTAAARVTDMLFPANDRNWDIQPLDAAIKQAMAARAAGSAQGQPDPQGASQAQPVGTGIGPGSTTDPHADEDACDAMRGVIQNQLDDSWYSEHGRRMIEDGCKIGIGVMKGPFTRLTKRKRFGFQRTADGRRVAILDVVEERVPQCTRVDPRYFYPENVRRMDECERAFELHLMSRAEVKELAQQDGIDAGAAELLLSKSPQLGQIGKNLRQWNKRCVIQESIDDRYAVWEMHGVLGKAELQALGLDDIDDDVDVIPVAELWFCQGVLLRASLSVLEADRRPPYWTWCYERADDSLYGYGVPWLYRNPQRSLDMLWLMLMHNLSVSSGPQIFFKDGVAKPVDGKYQIRGPKLWRVTDEEVDDVSKVFRAVDIPNNAPQLMDVLKLAMDLGDEEISLPSIAQGQPNEAVPTASGLIQLLNASNIVQRRAAKSMDDEVISPMVERFYVWNMLHNDDEAIKGDYAVSARGTSVLLHKDIKAQHLQIIAQITADPRFAVYLKEGEFLRELFEAADVSVMQLLRSDQEAEQMRQQQSQAQQQGPSAADQAKAEAALQTVQVKKQQLQLEQQRWQAEQQQQAAERAMLHQERMGELQDKADDRKAKLLMKQMELQIMAATLADKRGIALAQIEKDLRIAEMNGNLEQYLGTMHARIKAADIAKDQQEMGLKLDPANPTHTGI